MHLFDPPEFSLPGRARLNPHLAGARAHGRAWARAVGLPGPDPQGPVGTDHALLCAYTHPDAPGERLGLVTDWYTWLDHAGDHLLRTYERDHDLSGVKERLARLAALMPVDLADATPEPAGPVERGLADLWPRTAPGRSPVWRRRFAASTRRLLERPRRGHGAGEAPDPVAHIETRRWTGPARWSARLVEHALDVRTPPELVRARPLRELNDAFEDAVHLRDDLASIGNGVLVVERFVGCDARRAAEIAGELLTARVRRFEDLAATELPRLFEEYVVSADVRREILRYVDGLRAWRSGRHAWHLRRGLRPSAAQRSLAGPSGFGTSAAHIASLVGPGGPRLPVTGKPRPADVEPLARPRAVLSRGSSANARLDGVREHVTAWAGRMGMLDTDDGWDRPGFESADFGLFAALTHPRAAGPELHLAADWHVWSCHAAGALDRRDPAGAAAFAAGLRAFLPIGPAAMPPPDGPSERGLADLWRRTAPSLSACRRVRLADAVMDLVGGRLRELDGHGREHLLDPIDHIETRRKSCGATLTLALAGPPDGPTPEIAASLRALAGAFADIGSLRGDLFPGRAGTPWAPAGPVRPAAGGPSRGAARSGRGVTGRASALVLARFLGCGPLRGADLLEAMVTSRARRFERIAGVELPALLDDLCVSGAEREAVTAYADALRDRLTGGFAWARVTAARRAAPTPVRCPSGQAIPPG